jgi:hypothetical protein
MLDNWIPEIIKHKTITIPPPHITNGSDKMVGHDDRRGQFSVAAMYKGCVVLPRMMSLKLCRRVFGSCMYRSELDASLVL